MLGLRTSPRVAGTPVKQVERTRFHSRRARSMHVCLRTQNWTSVLGYMRTTCWQWDPATQRKSCCKNSRMAVRWGMVTDKPQEFLGRSLAGHHNVSNSEVSCEYVTQLCKDFVFGQLKSSNILSFEKVAASDTILDESGQRRHRQLLGRSLWLDRPDIKTQFVNCPLASA